MKKPTDRIIDINEKPKMLFFIKKWNNRYYGYTNHWKIYDVIEHGVLYPIEYKGKKHNSNFWLKHSWPRGWGWWVMRHDIPVVDRIERKINKNTGEVLEYNRDGEWN